MIKRLFVIFTLLCVVFSFSVSAEEAESQKLLEPYGEFYVLGEDNGKLSEILGLSAEELNRVEADYLAVNGDNSKQIRLTSEVTDFSNSIGNLSHLSNDKITKLVPDITGIESAKGRVIDKDGQKFIRVQLRSADSGGEYILTQYITVAARKSFILSFYTHINEDTEYIEKTFETFSSPLFISSSKDKKTESIQYVIIIAAVIFFVVCAVITVSIIIDLRKGKREEQTETEDINTEEPL